MKDGVYTIIGAGSPGENGTVFGQRAHHVSTFRRVFSRIDSSCFPFPGRQHPVKPGPLYLIEYSIPGPLKGCLVWKPIIIGSLG